MAKFFTMLLFLVFLCSSQPSSGSELELVVELPASYGISYIEAIEGLDNQPGEIVFMTRNNGAGCGGGTPASAFKLILDPDTGEVISLDQKQSLSKIQVVRQTLFASSDEVLFTGGGWCGPKPPYFSKDGGETWQSADQGTHPPNSTFSITEFNGDVYAGTGYAPYQAQLYRWLGDSGANHWEHVLTIPKPAGYVMAMTTYNNKLFVSRSGLHLWGYSNCANSVPVYASSDGNTFNATTGIPPCYDVYDFMVVGEQLVAQVRNNYQTPHGTYMYHWNDSLEEWEQVAPVDLGNYNVRIVSSGNLFFTYGQAPGDPFPSVYQSDDMGQSWEQIAAVDNVYSMDIYENTLYIGTGADTEGKVYIYSYRIQNNEPPEAKCKDIEAALNASGEVTISASDVDNGSFDPDGDPITLSISKTNFDCSDVDAQHAVTLTITDDSDASDTCAAMVTVVDTIAPINVEANAQATITPPDAPISFTATADDNCSVAEVEITDYSCYRIKKNGSQQSKMESCMVSLSGDTITIVDSGGVDDNIVWTILATDQSGNTTTVEGRVLVVNPGKKK